MKISKSVGKGSSPSAKDVMTVQKCLKSIKIKTPYGPQPIWKGKVEGKNSTDLVKAIETFQKCEGLKVTGKIESYGPAFQRLKQKTPIAIRNAIVNDPFMGELPQGHLLKEKETELKKLIGQLRGLPPMSAGNTLVTYWTTLKELGDPIADVALDIHYGRKSGIIALFLMKEHLGDIYFKNNPPANNELKYIQRPHIPYGGMFIPNEEWIEKQNKWINLQVRKIQIDVAIEHWNVSAKDNLGRLGRLSPDQIAVYHHKVFKKHKLPERAFGGTPFGGMPNEFPNNLALLFGFWCTDCDKNLDQLGN